MAKLASFIGRAILGAASVLAVLIVVLVGLGLYLVATPLRRHGLAPKYALGKAVVDTLVALNALAAAARLAGEQARQEAATVGDRTEP